MSDDEDESKEESSVNQDPAERPEPADPAAASSNVVKEAKKKSKKKTEEPSDFLFLKNIKNEVQEKLHDKYYPVFALSISVGLSLAGIALVFASLTKFIPGDEPFDLVVSLLRFSDVLLIAMTLMITGRLLYEPLVLRNFSTQSLSEALESVDESILKMVAITLAVTFLTEILDQSTKITFGYGFSIGFIFVCIIAYIYVDKLADKIKQLDNS